MATVMIKTIRVFIIFCLLVILFTQSLWADGGQWYLSRELFGRDRDIQIASLGEVVHAVWYRNNEIFWSYSNGGDSWSKPVAVFQGRGGRIELVSDGKLLQLFFFTSTNIEHRFYNGESWSTPKAVFKRPGNLSNFRITIADDKIHLFWLKWHYSKLIHGPMHLSMMHSVLENNEWTESTLVPKASNVDRSYAVYAGLDGRLELAWVQNTMGKLGKDYGLTFGLARRILLSTSYDPATKKWTRPAKHSTLKKGNHCEIHLIADKMGLLHLYWVEGYLSTKLRWRLRRNQSWEDLRIFKSLRGPTNAGVGLTPQGDVVCLAQSDRKKAGLCLIVAAGTSRERIYHAANTVSHSLQRVSLAISPSGIIHYVANHHYGRFKP
jgi:hypothetical protein